MSATRILGSLLIVFAATGAVRALLGDTPAEQLFEIVAVCLIAYAVFSFGVSRIRLTFMLLVTGVFLGLRAADLYWAPKPLLSGRLSWFVIPAAVAALFVLGQRMSLRTERPGGR